MTITYTITKENKTDKIGEVDPGIFDDSFHKDTLPTILHDHPQFIKWTEMIYGTGIHKKAEYRFADNFGMWLVYKIGEKGVSRSIELANIFESHYNDDAMNSVLGFNALVNFIQQDWDNHEKQFIETNSVRKTIEASVKRIKKIIKQARKNKSAETVESKLKPKMENA
jgi:hypothetical protein